MNRPYRQVEPHPHAVVCICGWRHPVQFRPTLTVETEKGARMRLVSTVLTFTCPDCGLEHKVEDIEPAPGDPLPDHYHPTRSTMRGCKDSSCGSGQSSGKGTP